ncbi:MAG TPA: restriction endonuclease [Gaiellaceae bacterium]|jgi:restriction system protein
MTVAATTTTTPTVTTPHIALPSAGTILHVLLPLWPLAVLIALVTAGRLALDIVRQRRLGRAGLPEIDRMDGATFERRLALLFRSRGYSVEATGKAGGDYGCDLVLSRDGRRRVVQAKRWRKNVGIKAVQEAAAARMHYQADDAMVVTNSYFTTQAQKLARSNHVELWDRPRLVQELLTVPNVDAGHGESTQSSNGELLGTEEDRFCARCGTSVSAKVATYCAGHPKRFGGLVYCYEHQRGL